MSMPAVMPEPAAPAVPAAKPRVPVVLEGGVRIPGEVADLDSFCRWACSDQFPERGRHSFLRGAVWVDLSREELFSHNQVRTALTTTLGNLVATGQLGRYLPAGMMLRNTRADLATEPDGSFISYEALRSGRVIRVEEDEPECCLLEGPPEVVMEVVSDSSEVRDTVELRELYWRAGIPEYWLVDARGDAPQFDLLKRGARGFKATRPQKGGWLRSDVFGRSFRLTRQADPLGDPQYTLEVRD